MMRVSVMKVIFDDEGEREKEEVLREVWDQEPQAQQRRYAKVPKLTSMLPYHFLYGHV